MHQRVFKKPSPVVASDDRSEAISLLKADIPWDCFVASLLAMTRFEHPLRYSDG